MVENSLDKITERLYPSRRKGTFGRKNERFENGCISFQDKEGGMDVMNVVVRKTGPPCAKQRIWNYWGWSKFIRLR